MNVTRQELFTLFMPLVQALHEKKVLDLMELPHYYEDALMRRLGLGEAPDDLVFLREVIQGLHRLSTVVCRPGDAPKP